MEIFNDDNFESTIRKYKEATEIAMARVLQFCMNKSKDELVREFETWDNDLLTFLSNTALTSEYYEICTAAKEVLDKRKKG